MNSLKITSTLLSIFIGYVSFSQAASIQNVKGNKALLVLDGDDLNVGDEVFSIDENGKKKSLLRITQVKNGKALSEVVKGKPAIGQTTITKGGASQSAEAESTGSAEPSSRSRTSGKSWGLLGALENDTMAASFLAAGNSITANMTGMSFAAFGYYDHPLTTNWQARATGGIQMYGVKGSISSAACGAGTTKDCSVDIMYLSGMGSAKYNFNFGTNKFWLGGGFGFLIPASKSSNVLDTGGISTNQLYAVQAGYDIRMGSRNYLPIMFEYGLFPSSSSVTASIISIRAGWAWNL